ncbi:MAG: hypothetical protein EPO51_10410 [Phenylobacterium sp.]|uniref:hypothetical protein n=1 Tax=Phenylobacterium sp. TaxID=1871053 RepID=UPI00121F0138|nr:hypothetical protein [Phenylobacterium sp.]TAJ72500.1 MAG: hypothetical protein EPO51_10410 [Phenylobacterium sp.]
MRGLVWLAAVALLAAAPADAAPRRRPPADGAAAVATLTAIRQAIDEQRLLDAGRLIDEAALKGARDVRLALLNGELNLAQGRYAVALASYRQAEGDPELRVRAWEGQGLALALMGRSKDAMSLLLRVVAADPTAWRSWNALGAQYDEAARWAEAEAAYAHALEASGAAAMVLNNRGYSRLLQRRSPEAIQDLVAAIQARPDLAQARTNLRLAIAMSGDYERAANGGTGADRAAWLNNAGFVAGLRGDYEAAERLLRQAQDARGEHYARATENLRVIRTLSGPPSSVVDAPR